MAATTSVAAAAATVRDDDDVVAKAAVSRRPQRRPPAYVNISGTDGRDYLAYVSRAIDDGLRYGLRTNPLFNQRMYQVKLLHRLPVDHQHHSERMLVGDGGGGGQYASTGPGSVEAGGGRNPMPSSRMCYVPAAACVDCKGDEYRPRELARIRSMEAVMRGNPSPHDDVTDSAFSNIYFLASNGCGITTRGDRIITEALARRGRIPVALDASNAPAFARMLRRRQRRVLLIGHLQGVADSAPRGSGIVQASPTPAPAPPTCSRGQLRSTMNPNSVLCTVVTMRCQQMEPIWASKQRFYSRVRACVRACVRVCVPACLRACVRACVMGGARPCVCQCVCAWIHAFVRGCMRSCVRAGKATGNGGARMSEVLVEGVCRTSPTYHFRWRARWWWW